MSLLIEYTLSDIAIILCNLAASYDLCCLMLFQQISVFGLLMILTDNNKSFKLSSRSAKVAFATMA